MTKPTDENGYLAMFGENGSAIVEDLGHAIEKCTECSRIRETIWIFAVLDHFPIRRVHPNEIDI